ncbi:PepSY-associated transmembrane protein [Humitalea rosea]|uniref:PepSY-associated transmembrane protein n=1 Tax=Humitalea rosea TaxID=990373 RepID=A0A2W7KDM2_9PROT|nr:PepSY domain-containing protein [Humitalea rosea]PZW45722.1 PepSY-associated transmembrane protein [Humitalea rosea]
MPKPLLLRLHRWIALAFALPLLLVMATGLFLAFEPALKAMTPAGTVTLARIEAAIAAADEMGARGALFVRGYDGTVSIGPRGGETFDLATAQPTQPGALAAAFRTARGLHERLLLDLGWLVTGSTIALILLAPLGLLLGWPRLRNTVAGWHRLAGWGLLPLVVGSPLTGLALAFGVSFAAPLPASAAAPAAMGATLRMVAARHSLDGLDFIRPMDGTPVVRVLDAEGTAVLYRAGADGLAPMPSNWPRLLHEGNWGGVLGSLANLVAAVALLGLLGTGVFIWVRRSLQRRRGRAARRARALAAQP